MINKILIICLFLISVIWGYSQDNDDWRTYKKNKTSKEPTSILQNDTNRKELVFNKTEGILTVQQDSKIDSLSSKISRNPFINGYTIQLEVSQQKTIIKDARYRFVKQNPDMPLDEEYDQPNTYLFGGRFYDKNTAYEFKHKIRNDFPDAIVIQKKLSLPPLNSN